MTETANPRPVRSLAEIGSRIDQIIGWAKDGARADSYLMDREKVDRMRDDIITYAFGESCPDPEAERLAPEDPKDA